MAEMRCTDSKDSWTASRPVRDRESASASLRYWRLALTTAVGLLTSWATPAANWPRAASFSARWSASWARPSLCGPVRHLVLELAAQHGEGLGIGHQPGRHGVADGGDGDEEGEVDEVGGAHHPGGDQGVVPAHGEEHAQRDELDPGVGDPHHVGLAQPVEGDDQEAQEQRPDGIAGRGHDGAAVGDVQGLEGVEPYAAGDEGGGEDPQGGDAEQDQLDGPVQTGTGAADEDAGVAEPGARVEGGCRDLQAGADAPPRRPRGRGRWWGC